MRCVCNEIDAIRADSHLETPKVLVKVRERVSERGTNQRGCICLTLTLYPCSMSDADDYTYEDTTVCGFGCVLAMTLAFWSAQVSSSR
jgi:hypothetical protein